MENVKHNIEEAELQGFEKKFLDGMKRLLMVVVDATQAEVEDIKCSYSDDEKKVLSVVVILNTAPSDECADFISKYTNTLCGHFSAFFTPAHYRPYMKVFAEEKENDKVGIVGMYEEGV
jgi:hypothetical protein